MFRATLFKGTHQCLKSESHSMSFLGCTVGAGVFSVCRGYNQLFVISDLVYQMNDKKF